MTLLDPQRDHEHDLTSLCDAAAALLAHASAVPTDGRVAGAPDARTVRWYQSTGLVDRPLRYDGRQAVYGYRHLLQVVATKLLQTRGHSLAEVQRALAGITTERLETAVQAELAPAVAVAGAAGAAPRDVALQPPPVLPPFVPAPTTGRSWLSVEIAPGVVVVVDPSRVPDPHAILTRLEQALKPVGGHP